MNTAAIIGRTILSLVITIAGLALIFDAFRTDHSSAGAICECLVGIFLVLIAISAAPPWAIVTSKEKP